MKTKQVFFSLAAAIALCILGASAQAAPNAKFVGTWNLDLTGTAADGPKSITLVTADAGGGKWKSTVTTVAADGKSSMTAVTYAADGKDYPLTGDPNIDSDAFTSPDPNTLVIQEKKGGKLVDTLTTKLSEDGNAQNATTVSADGKTTTTGVWKRK